MKIYSKSLAFEPVGTFPRLQVIWTKEARSDLRAIDRETALAILHCVDRFLSIRDGDVKKLQPPLSGFRLRCGDYRLLYRGIRNQKIEFTAVLHRKEAYRNPQ